MENWTTYAFSAPPRLKIQPLKAFGST